MRDGRLGTATKEPIDEEEGELVSEVDVTVARERVAPRVRRAFVLVLRELTPTLIVFAFVLDVEAAAVGVRDERVGRAAVRGGRVAAGGIGVAPGWPYLDWASRSSHIPAGLPGLRP